MDVIGWITSNLLAPVVSGAAGVGVTLWRTQAHVAAEVQKLQGDVQDLVEQSTKIKAEIQDLRVLAESNRAELQALKHRVDTQERDLQRLNQTMTAFTEDQGEQWLDIQRTLGQIEGQISGPPMRHPPPRRGLPVRNYGPPSRSSTLDGALPRRPRMGS